MPRFDLLDVQQRHDRAAAGAAAAAHVAALLRGPQEMRVVFACAPSQDEFLASLVRAGIDWSKIEIFHMDEYVGLDATHPASFRRYLREHLLDHVAPPRAAHFIRGEDSPEREGARYAALLAERPLDLVCLGIGENGHLAFNDPPVADFNDPHLVKVVELDEICRQQQVNDGCFPTLADVPTHALTLTIPALVSARRLSGVVPGPRKAAAIRRTLFDPVSTACPATVLRTHPDATLFIDDASASLLPS